MVYFFGILSPNGDKARPARQGSKRAFFGGQLPPDPEGRPDSGERSTLFLQGKAPEPDEGSLRMIYDIHHMR